MNSVQEVCLTCAIITTDCVELWKKVNCPIGVILEIYDMQVIKVKHFSANNYLNKVALRSGPSDTILIGVLSLPSRYSIYDIREGGNSNPFCIQP